MKIAVLSGKGGTGKMTTAASFIQFSQAEAIADCDVDAPNLHLVQNMSDPPRFSDFRGSDKAYIEVQKCTGCGACMGHCRFHAISMENGVCHVLKSACEGCGVCTVHAVSMQEHIAGGLALYARDKVLSTAELKMGCGHSGLLVTQIKQAMLHNAPDTDLAIIDGPPGIGCLVIASIAGVDLVLIVAEPSLSGLNDLKWIIGTANMLRTKVAVCINKYDVSPEHTQKIQQFCQERKLSVAGVIPYDKTTVAHAINEAWVWLTLTARRPMRCMRRMSR